MFYDCRAMAIGSRSQSARTYLERNIDAFASCDKESLIRHALLALRECLPTDASLTADNTTVAVASPDAPIAILNDEDAEPYIALVKDDVVPRGRAAAAERPQAQAPVQGEGLGAQPGADAPAPMDDAGDDV